MSMATDTKGQTKGKLRKIILLRFLKNRRKKNNTKKKVENLSNKLTIEESEHGKRNITREDKTVKDFKYIKFCRGRNPGAVRKEIRDLLKTTI